jgi:hypothetical protein
VTHKGSKPKESIFPAHVEHSSVDGNGGGDSSSAAADVDGRGNILERTSKRQRRNWKKDEPIRISKNVQDKPRQVSERSEVKGAVEVEFQDDRNRTRRSNERARSMIPLYIDACSTSAKCTCKSGAVRRHEIEPSPRATESDE